MRRDRSEEMTEDEALHLRSVPFGSGEEDVEETPSSKKDRSSKWPREGGMLKSIQAPFWATGNSRRI